MSRSRTVALVAVLWIVVAACGTSPPATGSGGDGDSGTGGDSGSADPAPRTPPPIDPDTPTGWGPTLGELDRARAAVASLSADELAGQVIVGRFHGTDPQEPARMVRELHLAGVQITSSSVVDRDQVQQMTAAVAAAHAADGREYPPVVGVDQEGGSVSHLAGVATEFPAFSTAGAAVTARPQEAPALVRDAARAGGLELRDLGFTWVFAPVADVTIGAADPTIGSRSASEDPAVAATAVGAAVAGYGQAGLVSTTKHFPGHGSATADSHEELPLLTSDLAELATHDLPPFRAAVEAGAPAVMVAHLDLPALAPGVPSSLAPQTYAYLRDELGFEGVAVTDSLGMGAVVATRKPAVTALAAGADLLLMPADTRRAARTVSRAIAAGELPRERVEEAAARVVAAQLWQQRAAGATPVPDDVAEQAAAASSALAAAAY